MSNDCHTILLVRPDGSSDDNYTYCEYESPKQCLETLCFVFEEHLRRHQTNGNIIYSLEDLFEFMGTFLNLSCLVKDKTSGHYIPYSIDWMKEQLFQMLGSKDHNKY